MRSKPIIRRDWLKQDLLDALKASLQDSFSRLTGETLGIMFSGGVDSSLAALLAKKVAKNTILLTVAGQNSHDATAAANSAKALSLELTHVILDAEVVWKTLPELISAIETSNQMDVEIALPFFLAAKTAKKLEIPLLVSGQGPDELFAGYARYVAIYKDLGEEELENHLWKDVSITHETNINRDIRAVAAHGLRVCFPFLYQSFVDIAMSVPAHLKIHLSKSPERKVVFRELALSLGLPKSVALAPKRATQYSSGSARIIREAIAENSELAKGLSVNKTRAVIQSVLDRIAADVGVSDVSRN